MRHKLHHATHSEIIRLCGYITSDAKIANYVGVDRPTVTLIRCKLHGPQNAAAPPSRRSSHYLSPTSSNHEGAGDLNARKSDSEKGCEALEDAIEALVRRTAAKLAIPAEHQRTKLAFARAYLGIEAMSDKRGGSVAHALRNAAMFTGAVG